MLTVGTTDECRVFHPFGFAIVLRERASDFEFLFNSVKKGASILGIEYNPTTIIADNAPSIENGFNKSFKKCEKRVGMHGNGTLRSTYSFTFFQMRIFIAQATSIKRLQKINVENISTS